MPLVYSLLCWERRAPCVGVRAEVVEPDEAVKRGDYFVASGEDLISSYAIQGSGDRRTIVAEVEWTFPLNFIEVVWGDGRTTDRQIISATHLPSSGTHRFRIPFEAAGKKWVRFAVWDVATSGAFVQPVLQPDTPITRSGR